MIGSHSKHLAIGLALLGLSAVASADATVTGTLSSDRWYYPFNATPGTRDHAGLFSYVQGPGPTFGFNYWDGQALLVWTVAIPPEIGSNPFFVSEARIEYYDLKDSTWNPNDGEIRAFAAGFGPTYNEATWAGTEAYVGGGISAGVRDPYPKHLTTGANAGDDPSAPSWGTVDLGTYAGSSSEAFKIVIELDVHNSFVQNELQADLTGGRSSWIIGATFPGAQPGPGPQPVFPQLITSEGVGVTTLGTVQEAPKLILELSTASAAQNWNLYE